MCFIDYAKAFDCVSHRKLWETMEQMGFPVHIIQLVANLYKEQESVVRTSNGDTEWFKIERGVSQGCVISPGLYNIYSEHIMQCVLEEHHDGITIGGRRQNNLQMTQPCYVQARRSCWPCSKRSKKPASHKTYC